MGNLSFIMEQKSNRLKILYHKFFVYLPVILIIFMIAMIYVSYLFCYILPLIHNWNSNVKDHAIDYPFAVTSSHRTSRTKGIALLITTFILIVLLLTNLLRTIFSDPGYFPSALELEYQIVMKNLIHQEEKNEGLNILNKEKSVEVLDNSTKDFNIKSKEFAEFSASEKQLEVKGEKDGKKRGFFKVDLDPKERANKKTLRKNPIEKNYFEKEDSIEIYKEDSLNLLNFSEKISESPICYEYITKELIFWKNGIIKFKKTN